MLVLTTSIQKLCHNQVLEPQNESHIHSTISDEQLSKTLTDTEAAGVCAQCACPAGVRGWGQWSKGRMNGGVGNGVDIQANQPSSSSRRLGAGKGAPGPSVVGSRTYPRSPNRFSDCSDERRPPCLDVFTGRSASLRDHPRELIESRNDEEAMFPDLLAGISVLQGCRLG